MTEKLILAYPPVFQLFTIRYRGTVSELENAVFPLGIVPH